jgi:hypothetical protein
MFWQKERDIVDAAVFSEKEGFDRVLVKMSRVKLPFSVLGLREDPRAEAETRGRKIIGKKRNLLSW